MSFFDPIQTWIIPEFTITESFREMSRDGKKRREGIALWLGRRLGGEAIISHLVFLRGKGIIKKANFLRIEPWLLNEVTDIIINLGVSIIGHIHSHKYGTDLSPSDREYGFKVPYYLSIVAHGFAMGKRIQITDCGIHIFEKDIGYKRLSIAEVKKRIKVITDGKLPILVVGNG